jgi:hypothetical protein
MLSVQGTFKDGVAHPAEAIEGHEGQRVIITFVEEPKEPVLASDEHWDALMHLIEASTMETGIEDLAHQHDHYLYGKPKGES